MNKIHQTMRDSGTARWIALFLISFAMFFAYMFSDVLSPLQTMLDQQLNWSPDIYGTFVSSVFVLNVFAFFLIFAGIILDKMGIRFTAMLAGSLMVVGGAVKLYAVSSYFVEGNTLYDFLDSFWTSFPGNAKLASIGFALFGCGWGMAASMASKAIVRWFSGKELALAMALELAIARFGVFIAFRFSPYIASMGEPKVVRSVAVCCGLLCIGLISLAIYCLMDKKLDNQMHAEAEVKRGQPFKISDIGILFTKKSFLILAFLCSFYYASIYPFQKFATNMLENRLGIPTHDASALFSWFPIGAMVFTPLLGWFLDRKGKGASMLILGALLMLVCHAIFAFYPLSKDSSGSLLIAYTAIFILGVSFSLVPAAIWPSIPKLVEGRYLGSGYAIVFWLQNFGVWSMAMFIGKVLSWSNPGVSPGNYDYTSTMLIFASAGVLASLLALWLKRENKKHSYGLELPNIKK